jgi:hypothetical protein
MCSRDDGEAQGAPALPKEARTLGGGIGSLLAILRWRRRRRVLRLQSGSLMQAKIRRHAGDNAAIWSALRSAIWLRLCAGADQQER